MELHDFANHCNILQYSCRMARQSVTHAQKRLHPTAIHCNTLQHNATHLLRSTPIHTTRVKETAKDCSTLHHATTGCNTLHHTKTLQHTCRAARQSMPRAPKSSWHKLLREVRCIDGISKVSSLKIFLCKITLEPTFHSTHYAPHARTHAHMHTCTHAHTHTCTHARTHTNQER